MVDVGVPAFMPGSQVDVRPAHDLDQFLGQDIPVKVLKLNRRRGNVVVSRKIAVEEDQKVRKERAGAFVRRRRGSGHGKEFDGLRRIRGFRRHRRIVARQRSFARARNSSV